MSLSERLSCLFGRHDWRTMKIHKCLSPMFAAYFGNAEVECKRCGKKSVMYAKPL